MCQSYAGPIEHLCCSQFYSLTPMGGKIEVMNACVLYDVFEYLETEHAPYVWWG